MSYPENMVSRWLCRPRFVGARGVMEHYLGGLNEPYLFQGIVEYLKLLDGQVSIDFDHDTLHADPGTGCSGNIDQGLFAIQDSMESTISECCYLVN